MRPDSDFLRLYNDIAERDLLGAVVYGLQDGDVAAHQAILDVPSEAFFARNIRGMWDAVKSLHAQHICPDLPNVRAELTNLGSIKTRMDEITAIELFTTLPMFGGCSYLAGEVLGLYQRRAILKVIGRAEAACADLMNGAPAEIASSLAAEVMALVAGGDSGVISAGDAIAELVANRSPFRPETNNGKTTWFGIPEIDGTEDEPIIPGCAEELIIVGARPGCGKTALIIQSAVESASRGKDVFLVSLELNRYECKKRIAAYVTLTSGNKFYTGTYSDQDAEQLLESHTRGILNKIKIWAKPSRCGWAKVESAIRSQVLARGATNMVVIIDHFALIGKPKVTGSDGAHSAWMDLIGWIRSLTQQLKISTLLICQSNRGKEKEEPDLQNLASTMGLEQEAQTILFLWRELAKGQKPDAPPEGETFLKIEKNRNGQGHGKFQMNFDGATNRFSVKVRETSSRARLPKVKGAAKESWEDRWGVE